MEIAAIVAFDEDRVIGYRGALPWKIPEDMKHFSDLTTGHLVLMGRKTYESLPLKYRPLPNRRNLVATRSDISLSGAEVVHDLSTTLSQLKSEAAKQILWVIGGAEIYLQTLPWWDTVYVTRVEGCHKGDAHFPVFESLFHLVEEESRMGYKFQKYQRMNEK